MRILSYLPQLLLLSLPSRSLVLEIDKILRVFARADVAPLGYLLARHSNQDADFFNRASVPHKWVLPVAPLEVLLQIFSDHVTTPYGTVEVLLLPSMPLPLGRVCAMILSAVDSLWRKMTACGKGISQAKNSLGNNLAYDALVLD